MVSAPRPDSRILIAGRNRDLNDALLRLLAQYRPALNSDDEVSILSALRDGQALCLVILDDSEPDRHALDVLQRIRENRPDVAVLVMSAYPTVEHATESIRRGAEDFVPVPYAEEVVLKEVARILEAAELRTRVESLDRLVATRYGFERVISRSPHMRRVMDRALAAARSETPVLIVGETGTGKELIARAIHANSRRARRPFMPINCAALPRDLVESELFGHRRGAFSGAVTEHPGLFVAAHGGSLFLDETTDNYIFMKVLHPDALVQPSMMPTFGFAPADAAKIAVALASIRKVDLPASYVRTRPRPAPFEPGGRFGELVTRYRCLSCHSVGGFGGDLSTVPLDRIGSQLKREYVSKYLLNPGAVRVSVETRMPVFHMLPDGANTIADYMSTVLLDDGLDRYDTHFTATDVRRGQELYSQLGCAACHQLGNVGGYAGAGRPSRPPMPCSTRSGPMSASGDFRTAKDKASACSRSIAPRAMATKARATDRTRRT